MENAWARDYKILNFKNQNITHKKIMFFNSTVEVEG